MNRRKWLTAAASFALLQPAAGRRAMGQNKQREKVIVVGAGIAGVAAARELTAKGFDVVVLEARDRIGGRIWTDRSLSVPVDLGAASIELAKSNPLTPLARQWQIPVRPIDYGSVAVYEADAGRIDDEEAAEIADRLEDLITVGWRRAKREAESGKAAPVQSVGQFLRQRKFVPDLSTERGRAERWAIGVQTCEYGAEPDDLSLAWFDGGFDEDWDDLLVVGGFDRIVEHLAQGLDIRLGHEVSRIEYGDDRVRVVCPQGTFEAGRAIVTLPLGVLQSGMVEFSPALPEKKRVALRRLAMGSAEKIVLEYAEAFWPRDVDFLGYASRQPGEFPQFLSLMAATGSPVLSATTAGEHARFLLSLSTEEALGQVHRALDAMFGRPTPRPVAYRVTRWGGDRFARGAYSYVPVGASEDDYIALAEPVGERLFFAGEATSHQHPSTVHGAYFSGLREAERILMNVARN